MAPRMHQSTNWRDVAKPQVWFRIVHVAADGHHRATADGIREQTVEIALGSRGAFRNGNVGVVKRCGAMDWGVSALPGPGTKPKHPRAPKTPRVVQLLRKAVEWQRQLDAGDIASQAAIARREGISRARVTQIMGLLRLTQEIRDRIAALPETTGRVTVTERALRSIVRSDGRSDQADRFDQLVGPSE